MSKTVKIRYTFEVVREINVPDIPSDCSCSQSEWEEKNIQHRAEEYAMRFYGGKTSWTYQRID